MDALVASGAGLATSAAGGATTVGPANTGPPVGLERVLRGLPRLRLTVAGSGSKGVPLRLQLGL